MAEFLIVFSLLVIFVLIARRLPDVSDKDLAGPIFRLPILRISFLRPSGKFSALKVPKFSFGLFRKAASSGFKREESTPTPPPKAISKEKAPQAVAKEEVSEEEQASYQVDEPLAHLCSPLVQTELVEADRYFEEGKFRVAERRYLEIAAKDPKCIHALNRLGIIFLEQNSELEDAEQAFRTALKFASRNGFLLHNLGLTLYRQGKYSEAAVYFEKSVEGGSRVATRYANLGICYMALRQYTKAVSALRKALVLDKNNPRLKELLEEANKKAERHKNLLR